MDKYLARFWQKVKKSEYGCWEWTAGKTAQGYGQFYYGRPGYAHRFAYERLIAPIPEGKMVRHECDNPSCVRPSHLMLGDQFDNMADMYERRRNQHAKGERHGKAKLTDQQVIGIYKSPLPHKKIAAKFGVGTTCVRDIKNGRTWAHVTGHEKQENPYPARYRAAG